MLKDKTSDMKLRLSFWGGSCTWAQVVPW